MRRLLTAAVLVPLVIGAIFGLSSTAFAWAIVVVLVGCAWEYAEVNGLSRRPWAYALVIAALLPVFLGILAVDVPHFTLPGMALTVGVIWLFVDRTPVERRAGVIAMATFGVVYFVVAATALVSVQAADPWTLLLLVAIVALGDSAAFYAGRTFGRRKLAPLISPKKTWEGSTASLLVAVAVAVGWALATGRSPAPWLLVGVVTNAAAQIGDLLESTFKRRAGVKDSSDLLPGHGGIWDRTDAILLAAPVFAWLVGSWQSAVGS